MAHFTSGDLLADRRFAYAEAMASDGDRGAAIDLYRQALERVPDWAPAWLALALALESTGLLDEARTAMKRAADLDDAGTLGAALQVARFGHEPSASMPTAYVATLFDQYAPRFDAHLTGSLGYRAPEAIVACLDQIHPLRRFDYGLDLGCGTGLMAKALAGRVERLDGVDVSSGMIEQARTTGLYATLMLGDMTAFMQSASEATYDLVLAADVFMYCGDLPPLFRAIRRVIRPKGVLAFTVQRSDTADVELGPDLRFNHGEIFVRAALADAGFRIDAIEPRSTRRERGIDVPGLVAIVTAA